MKHLDTPEKTREFLRLCLDPGHGIQRTPDKLAEIMPPQMRDRVETFAPHLMGLRDDITATTRLADQAKDAYTAALVAWINDEPEPVAELNALQAGGRIAELAAALLETRILAQDLPARTAVEMAAQLLAKFHIQPLNPTERN